MAEWFPLDDSGDLWGLDDAPRLVVSLSELEARKSDLLSKGVKTEPDAETLEVYNRINALEQAKLVVDEIDRQIAEINAVKGE